MPLKPVVSVQHSTSTEFKGIQIGPSNESPDLFGSVEGSFLTKIMNRDVSCHGKEGEKESSDLQSPLWLKIKRRSRNSVARFNEMIRRRELLINRILLFRRNLKNYL